MAPSTVDSPVDVRHEGLSRYAHVLRGRPRRGGEMSGLAAATAFAQLPNRRRAAPQLPKNRTAAAYRKSPRLAPELSGWPSAARWRISASVACASGGSFFSPCVGRTGADFFMRKSSHAGVPSTSLLRLWRGHVA